MDGFLPLTINRQLIELKATAMSYQGGQVPYWTPRAAGIWEAAEKAAAALKLRGVCGHRLSCWANCQGRWT